MRLFSLQESRLHESLLAGVEPFSMAVTGVRRKNRAISYHKWWEDCRSAALARRRHPRPDAAPARHSGKLRWAGVGPLPDPSIDLPCITRGGFAGVRMPLI